MRRKNCNLVLIALLLLPYETQKKNKLRTIKTETEKLQSGFIFNKNCIINHLWLRKLNDTQKKKNELRTIKNETKKIANSFYFSKNWIINQLNHKLEKLN